MNDAARCDDECHTFRTASDTASCAPCTGNLFVGVRSKPERKVVFCHVAAQGGFAIRADANDICVKRLNFSICIAEPACLNVSSRGECFGKEIDNECVIVAGFIPNIRRKPPIN